MDNNEVDKVLKEKLSKQITPSKEFEQKIQNTIKEQKIQKESKKQSFNPNKFKRIKFIVSMAAVIMLALMIGISFKDNINFEQKTITVATITKIKPTKSNNQILASDSEFLISAEGENLTLESIQKALYVQPALEYTIEKTNNSNEYKLTFKQNIPNNTIVKLQYVKDQITLDSWAYQTSTELSVNGTYPANLSTSVPKNTVIEIQFSYASVENFEEHVEISPKINGTWEHLGKVWRFTPQSQLNNGLYRVTVKSGIIAEQKTLKNDYTFSFEVGEWKSHEYIYNTISIDKINTYKPNEDVRIYCQSREIDSKLNISKIDIAKFAGKDEFIEYLQKEDYSKAALLGEYEFTQTEKYVQLNKNLQTGYYVAIIYNSNRKEMFNCPIQINELSAYAIETERDVLVWVANGNNLAKDVQVEYKGKVVKTNNDGIAEFKDIADGSEQIKYLGIGNASNKLIIGIYNYNLENYPQAYLYTDRPLYKNTDTINIWGFVPVNQFYDEVQEEFYIELNSEGKQKVKVGEDGNLNYAIQLKNHVDDYSYIKLYYKDQIIASRDLEIKNYEAQNYTYDISYNKNYAVEGTKFEFDVKINHITGLTVPNKTIRATCDGKTFKATSGEDGIAHFAIDIPNTSTEYSSPNYKSITVYNGDLEEYTEAEDYISIYVLSKDTYTKTEVSDTNICKATLYKLSTDKNVTVDYSLSNLYNGLYDTSVNILLKETTHTRYISSYKYNPYTNQSEPIYSYRSNTVTHNVKTINTKNGMVEIDVNELSMKKDTEEQSYTYNVVFEYRDQNGERVADSQHIYLKNTNKEQEVGFAYIEDASSDALYQTPTIINNDYYVYRYFLSRDNSVFSIGETVEFKLKESTSNGNKEIKNAGKILRIVFQEDITEKKIITNDNLNYKFSESDFPGCKITSAYFLNGKFYRMPIYYFDFKQEDRKVDIEITADKEKYQPGDEVTLKVKTTNNGKAVKSFVNISVVNKAVLELQENPTYLLQEIYRNRTYPVYTYSSYKDYIEYGDGRGGGRRRRSSWKIRGYRLF